MRYSPQDLDILARTLLGESEARDEDDAKSIALVVLNRMSFRNWPDTAVEVCQQPWQFSCWNQNDPNRRRILAATDKDSWFVRCREIARQALDGELPDHTFGATHYWATYIKEPAWAKGKTPCYVNTYGKYSHRFYNDIDTKPPRTPKEALDQVKPLTSSRTVQGLALAAAGTALDKGLNAVSAIDPTTLSEWRGQVDALLPMVPQAKWLALGLVVAGIVGALHARVQQRQKGLD